MSADAGTTSASLIVAELMEKWTVAPGFSVWSGFAASAQTSTVVLLGSSAGLTTVSFAGIASSLPGTVRVAASPFFNTAASLCGICALAITRERSITVINGVP